jgi:DegV family protein with EDD domain
MAVKVVTDSTSYVPRDLRRELDMGVVSLFSLLGGVTYDDDAEDYEPFYTALEASGEMPTTSQPTVQDMVDLLEERVAAGHEVVGVFISDKMSGTFSTAQLARDMVLERHPDAVIELVDSKSNSMDLGFVALAAARAAAAGEAVAGVVAAARATIERTRFLFLPATLEYLRRGGRIGNASALIGSLLQIKPILTVTDGQTDVFAKVRTPQKALGTIVEQLATDMRERGGIGGVIVHHIHDEVAGRNLAARVAEVVGHAVDICPIGPAIGAHVGPGAVAVIYHTVEPIRSSG